MPYTFKKTERLCSLKALEALFQKNNVENRSFLAYPVKVIYRAAASEETTTQVVFSVSKRGFKRAVQRNLLKRRLREAYRLQKELLQTAVPQHIAFIYVGKTIEPYAVIEKGMRKALKIIGS